MSTPASFRTLVACLLFSLALNSIAFGAFVIEKNGIPGGIVVNADAPDSVNLAAKELQTYLQRITGAEIPIRNTADKSSAFTIYLGGTPFAKEKGVETESLPPDGFRILADDNWMIIAGKDYAGAVMTGYNVPYRFHESYNTNLKISAFGDTGTLQGVYEFLRKNGGVRWYMPGPLGEIVPAKEKVVVEKMDVKKHPEFEQRHAYFGFFSSSDEDSIWYKRVGFGCPFPAQVSHSFGQYFMKFKDTNPEYFAIIDGEPDFTNRSVIMGGGNYNLSQPGLIKEAVKIINQYFDENPEQKIFPLCPNDGLLKISEDPESQAQIDLSLGESGRFSNYIWGFINKVAIEVAKTHPDRLIGCIAYERYTSPPSNIEKLSPNVAVVICKLRRGNSDAAYLKDQRDGIEGWLKKASVVYAWEYYCDLLFNAGWKGYPVFYPELVQDDLLYLKGKVRGEYLESESWMPHEYANRALCRINYPGLQHPLLYVTAQLLWDPSQNLEAMLDEYFLLFYGEAEAEMRKFWKIAENSWITSKSLASPSSVYKAANLREMLDCLEQAKKLTEVNSPYRQRIELIEKEFLPAALRGERLTQLEARAVSVAPLTEKDEIDGDISNTHWENATLVSLIDRSYASASPATHIRMGWTPEALKIAVVAFEPQMKGVKTDVTLANQHADSKVWEDDSFEVFLKPEGGANVFHIITTANGVIFDQSNSTGDWKHGDPSWKSEAQVAVKKEKNSWVLEMSIPWKSLGVSNPKTGLTIMSNMYRNRFATGTLEQFSWAPIVEGMYFAPDHFGKLTLSGQTEN